MKTPYPSIASGLLSGTTLEHVLGAQIFKQIFCPNLFEKQQLFFALRFMWFTTLMRSSKASSSTGTISLAESALWCKKQWLHVALGALSRICFTTPECFLVMAAAPSVVSPTQYSHLRPEELKYKSTVLKMSSAFVVLCCSVVEISAAEKLFLQITIPYMSHTNQQNNMVCYIGGFIHLQDIYSRDFLGCGLWSVL